MTTAIILAGGLGTRLRAAVPDLPKPMAPIDGRPFLEHQMDYWLDQGVRRFILSVGYRREHIIGHFGRRYRGAAIEYAIEEQPLGTGGGLSLALALLKGDEPVLLLNGDTFFEATLASLRDFFQARRAQWVFSLFRTDEAGRYMGMAVDDDGCTTSLRSGHSVVGALANAGVYLVDPGAVRAANFQPGERFSLEDDLLPRLQSSGARLYGKEFSGRFIDIGVPADYARAAAILRREKE